MKTEGGFLRLIFLLLAGLLPFLSQNASAQSAIDDKYLVNWISMSDGLPANFVDYIYKDSSGFVWIATSGGGLSRFDGTDFLTFTSHTVPRLSSFVTCVTEDYFRRLWVTSVDGLYVLELETLHCKSLPISELQALQGKNIRFITTDANGNVWLKYDTVIYRISFNREGEVDAVLTFSDPMIGIQDNFLRDVEGDGTVWTSYGSRLVRLFDNGGVLTAATVIDNLPIEANAYVSDCLQKDNEVWISTERGLLRCDRNSGKVRHYRHSAADDRSLSQNFLTALCLSFDGQPLVSSLKGLNVYDQFSDSFGKINSETGSSRGPVLSSDFINCINKFGNQIWIGTESAGIVVISPKLLSVSNYAHEKDNPASIAPNPVNSILEDGKGRVWTGSVEAGLCWTYPGTGIFHNFTTKNSGLAHNSVSTMECDADGNLWIGTWGGGISILSLDRLQFVRNITATDLPISFIGALKYDSVNNYMWIGSNVGIFVCDLLSGEISPVLEDQPFGSIGACMDRKDRMWIGCQRGLYVFDLHSRNGAGDKDMFSFRLVSPGAEYSDRINCVSIISDGSLWVGTNGNGIYRLDSEDEDGNMHFSRFSTEDGLANDMAKGILDDVFGRIWISTEYGLSCFNLKTMTFTNYYTGHGLSSSQFYWNASAKLSDGTLYFGQVDGLTVVNPQKESRNYRKFNLRFTRLTIGEKDIVAGDKQIDRDISYADEVRLHQRDKSIGFEFALLDYGAASPAICSYRLKNFDDEWIPLRQNRHFISFANLPAGNYTLQIRAMDSESQVLGETEINIRVARYFYRSWWFFIMSLIVIGRNIELLDLLIRFNYPFERIQLVYEDIKRHGENVSRIFDSIISKQLDELLTPFRYEHQDNEYRNKGLKYVNHLVLV